MKTRIVNRKCKDCGIIISYVTVMSHEDLDVLIVIKSLLIML